VGRILALDHGDRRIGIAVSDPLKIIASPHGTIDRRKTPDIFSEISHLISQLEIEVVVVGLPLNMKGLDSDQTRKVRSFISDLQNHTAIAIHTVDERLSSSSAEQSLVQRGVRTGKKKGAVDSTAAAIFLQEYLDSL